MSRERVDAAVARVRARDEALGTLAQHVADAMTGGVPVVEPDGPIELTIGRRQVGPQTICCQPLGDHRVIDH